MVEAGSTGCWSLGIGGGDDGPSYAANDTEIYIVQGLPGKNLDVAIDGESVAEDVKTAAVAGPFKVEPGSRTVTFSEDGTTVLENTFSIKEGSKADIVAHLPASSSGDPLVTVYKYDDIKVPKGKAFLVVSHVAAVPPPMFGLMRRFCSRTLPMANPSN